jgi:hypothetical protein
LDAWTLTACKMWNTRQHNAQHQHKEREHTTTHFLARQSNVRKFMS